VIRTRAVLKALGNSRASGLLAVVEVVGVALLLPLVIASDIARMHRLAEARSALRQVTALRCPSCRRAVSLDGDWTCAGGRASTTLTGTVLNPSVTRASPPLSLIHSTMASRVEESVCCVAGMTHLTCVMCS
jgi:hypothetical protein